MKRISQILRIFLAHLWKLVYSMFHDKTARIPLNHCMAKPTTESPFLMTIWTFLQLKSPTLPIFTKTPQYRWSTHWVNHANNLKVKIKEKSSNGQLKEAVVAFHFSLIPVYDSTKKKDSQKTKLPNQWGIYLVCFNLGSKTFLKSLKVLYYDPDLTQFIKQNSKRVLIYILREHFQANKTQMNIKSPDLQSRRQLKSAIKNLFLLVLSMESNDILHRPLLL